MGLSKDVFLQQIHEYYGDHKNKIVMQITKEYIMRTYKPESYKKLLNAIYRTHRSAWGYPDVAAIESAHERFMKSDSYDLKKKDVSEYHQDFSISDDEWRDGFAGMDALKNAVMIGKVEHEQNDKLDNEKLQEIKELFNKAWNRGEKS